MATSTIGTPHQSTDPASEPVPLWRNLQFQTLWVGSAASSLGVSVADVAYPLAILALTGSPAKAGLFAAVLTIGMVAGSLPGGQLADRRDRRAVVIIAEGSRAIVTAVVAVGLILGWMSLPVLLAAAAVLGVGQAMAGAARLPLVRSVVPSGQLTRALIQDEVRQNGALLAGPPLAGALYGIRALSHSIPFLSIAAAFAFSMLAAVAMKAIPRGAAGTLARSGRPAPAPAGPPGQAREDGGPSGNATQGDERAAGPTHADGSAAGARVAGARVAGARAARATDSGMLAGVRTLWRDPVLRAVMLLIMTANMIGSGIDLAVIVILRHQHVGSGTIGLALGAGAIGGLAGAPLVKVLHRLQPGVLLLGMGLSWIPIFALLAIPFGPLWVAGLLFLAMLGVPALRVLVDVLIIRQTPDEQRGRVVAAGTMLISVGIPAGVAGTGLLLEWLPAQSAMLVLAAVLASGVLYCASKRELWRARWPQ
jgi:MFS family permease